jgi:hypothetical protein
MTPPQTNVRRPRPRRELKRAWLSAALTLFMSAALCCAPAAAAGLTGAAKKKSPKPAAPAKPEEAQPAAGRRQEKPAHIGIEHEQSAYPSEGALKKYRLVVKRKADSENFFENDPKLISLSVSPAGASDVTVRLVTPTRIEADFWAPEGFEVGEVSVSVYDRDDPRLVAATSDVEKPKESEGPDAAKGAKAKAKAEEAAAQPKINSTAIVFLQRAYGIGRMKIEGENFGNYGAPPVSAEDYLLCFEPLARQALLEALRGNPNAKAQQGVEDKRCDDLRGTDKYARWKQWRDAVESSVKVSLVPRNTDLRIEQAKVLYIDDKFIDVYFEFNRYYRHSEPLRLASTTVSVRKGDAPKPAAKPAAPQGQTAAARQLGDAVVLNASAGAAAPAPDDVRPAPFVDERKTYIATKEVGTRQDENLEYRYTVLDSGSATTLFGKGVAESFYVIQLSVTNKGDRKVAIPLASIQAEVEWAYGPAGKRPAEAARAAKGAENYKSFAAPASYANAPQSAGAGEIQVEPGEPAEYYEEGPPTLAPLPLPAVTAFFDGDMKVNGKKAKFFNVTDGLATLGSSLIPFFGPGFRDAHVAFTGGLVPGIRRGLGDLSSQQLQNLTALSWQGVEVVAGRGGSLEKFVFIQRGDQLFSQGFGERLRKTIKNIEGMEVVGFEVRESEPVRATPAGQQ